jgi:internalin A
VFSIRPKSSEDAASTVGATKWLRFNLRTFLVTVTLVGVGCGMWGYRAKSQRDAVDWVIENGGEVLYQYNRQSVGRGPDGYVSNARIPMLQSVFSFLDIHYFSSVTLVKFEGSNALDLSPIVALKKLNTLILRDTKITDLSPIQSAFRLASLAIQSSPIEDLRPLSNMPNLEMLTLDDVPVVDLEHLLGCERLAYLQLINCNSDEYSHLAKLSELEYLFLENVPIKSLSLLNGLKLKSLVLENIGTAELSPLSELHELESVSLSSIEASDLSPLSKLSNLKQLLVAQMPVTQFEIDALQESLRNCKISFFPSAKVHE